MSDKTHLPAGGGAPPRLRQTLPPMNLNQYGSACRCLLRLRENSGEPGISDGLFISQYLSRFPEWQERPGVTDASALCELAKDLKLAETVEFFRDYDHVRQERQAGRSILVLTERIPEQAESSVAAGRYVMLVEAMDATQFSVWCPYPSGQSDQLPKAARAWWDKWMCIGVVLYPPRKAMHAPQG